MLELLVQLLLELILPLFGEILFEGLGHLRPLNRAAAVTTAFLGYALLGAVAGGLSLLLYPEHFIRAPGLRVAALILVPVVVGLCMSLVGRWRARRGDPLMRIDRFAYAFVCAFSMSLVRWWFAS